jgi:hypothetical protein
VEEYEAVGEWKNVKRWESGRMRGDGEVKECKAVIKWKNVRRWRGEIKKELCR